MHDNLTLGTFSARVPSQGRLIHVTAELKPTATVARAIIPTGSYQTDSRHWDRTYRIISGCGTRCVGDTIAPYGPGDIWDVDAHVVHGLVQVEEETVVEVTQHLPNRTWNQ